MPDPYRLARFVTAQEQSGTYERALSELHGGAKRSHWMWFVFPQIAGLGRSAMAQEYAIDTLAEARAYLADPILGPRLRACAQAVCDVPDRTAEQILGGIDAMKLRSSMTLFARAAPDEEVFRRVLDRFFDGREDDATLQLLR